MSLTKLRNLTQRNQSTQSLKKFGRNFSRSHLKTSTIQPNPQVSNRFQQQLNQHGISSSFMRNLFERRCDENQIRPEEDKYRIFTRHFLSKLLRTFEVSELRLKEVSMGYFLKGMTRNNQIVGLDLSNTKLNSIDPILDLITYSESVCKLHLCNMSLQPKDFPLLFDKITEMQRIIHLDLSNRTFEGANKLGDSYHYLSNFVSNNKIIQILQLQGLSIRDKGLEALIEGFKNKQSKLVSLNLKNNGFSRNGYSYIRQIIYHTFLMQLDLSDNRLGSYGINDLDIIRSVDIMKLNLSNTDMQSEGLCNLLHIIKDHKTLNHVILDRNNFQHNWFKRIEESISNNRNLKILSMNNCHIIHMDSLFRGLLENRILSKLQISYNNITDEILSLIELIKRNNSIKQMKLRQCGIEGDKTVQLFSSILKNTSLMILDISDNNIGIDAGKQLLKTVMMNHHLTSINLEKTQIQLSVKLNIDTKLSKNKISYQRQLRNDLKKQSSILKLKQQSKNINLPQLRQHANNNNEKISKAKEEITKLSQILTKKNQDKKMNLNNFDMEMASLNKQLIQVQVQAKPGLKELDAKKCNLDRMVEDLNELKEKEMEIVRKLEKQLELERNSIKGLENRLEKQLENEKYLNKKNNASNTKLPLILIKPQSPVKPIKPVKTNYKQIKNISKIDVVRPH